MPFTRQQAASWCRALLESLVCLAIGLLIWLIMVGILLEDGGGDISGDMGPLLAIDVLLGIPAALAVGPLRRAGRANLAIALVLPLSTIALPAGLVALTRLGGLRSLRIDVLVLAWMLLASVLSGALDPATASVLDPLVLTSALMVAAIAAALLLWGRARATRTALVVSLREQAAAAEARRAAAERERASAVASVRAQERTEIARDMHDSLSHHLSVIAMSAGAIAYREDLPPETVRNTAETLREAAAAANAELREVLLALRTSDADGPDADSAENRAPLPTGRSLDRLVTSARNRGSPVALHWEGIEPEDLEGVPRTTAVGLQRIVGEFLTNASKHAPGLPLHLRLRRERADAGDVIVLRAVNPLPTAPPAVGSAPLHGGYGLVGVDERARLLGGQARYGIIEDGSTESFCAEVRIPWTP